MPLIQGSDCEKRVSQARQGNTVRAQQRRVGPRSLLQQNGSGVHIIPKKAVGYKGYQRKRRRRQRNVRRGQGVGYLAIAAGHHQRIVLDNVVGVISDSVNPYSATRNCH